MRSFTRTPADRAAISARVTAWHAAQTRCRQGHRLVQTGARRLCPVCRHAAVQRWRDRQRPAGLVPVGVPVRVRAARVTWAHRKDRFGATGFSPAGLHAVAQNLRRVNQKLYARKAAGRPVVVVHQGGRVHVAVHDAYVVAETARLKRLMVAAHPDKGGTSARFRAARQAWTRFLATEQAWYGAIGLTMPSSRREDTAA